VALVLSRIPGTRPRDIRAAVQTRLTELSTKLPEGLALDLVFDAVPGAGLAEYLGIDVVLPDSASTERTLQVVRPLEALTRAVGGVREVLALSESPFDRSPTGSNRAYLLVRLQPAGKDRGSCESIMKSIRGVFDQFPGARLLLRDLGTPSALPNGGYAVRLAVHTAADLGMSHLQATADSLAKRLNEKPILTDVFSSFRAHTPWLRLDIDRKKAVRLGVDVDQILKVLQSAYRLGQAGAREGPEALLREQVPNNKGERVPLAAVVQITAGSGPTVIDRLDLEATAEITANLAPGVSLAEARALCEEEARTTLPKEYRLTWLSEMPPPQEAK
jgi:multidrug efflux pump subunit AcrB